MNNVQRDLSDRIKKDLRKNLEHNTFSTWSDELKAKRSVQNILNEYLMDRYIVDHNIKRLEDVKIECIWNNFNFKQKLKWYFYDRFLNTNKLEVIKFVDAYNDLVFELNEELCKNKNDDDHIVLKNTIEYPDYAQPNPKYIIISDIKISSNHCVDFLIIKITIDRDIAP